MSLNISFSAYKLVTTPFSWAYDLEDMGFQGWEIVSEARQKISPETLPEIRDIINSTKLKISVHAPFSDLNLAALNDAIWNETINQIRQCIELSADFSDRIVVHPGILSPLGNQMPDKAYQRNVEGLKILCGHAKEYGVRVCLENMINMDKMFCRTPHELLGMIEAVDHECMGMTFDIGHANTTKTVADFLKQKAHITHIHAHDNHGVTDEHLEVGTATVNWNMVLKELKEFDGTVVIEARNIEEGKRGLKFIRDHEKAHP